MPDKPSRLLRCPLPEGWRKRADYFHACDSPEKEDSIIACIHDLETWLNEYNRRIEPLLVALVESGSALASHVDSLSYDDENEPHNCKGCQDGSKQWDAAKKAFLEGVGKL